MIKALVTPPEDTSLAGRARSLWWAFQWRVAPYLPGWLRYRLPRWWYEQVSSRLWPRQRWLTRQIPRQWCDKTELLPTLLYAAVIHFVEQEDCFRVNDWAASGHAEHEARLREVYAWAKTGRAAALQRIEDAHPPLDPSQSLRDWLNDDNPARDAAYREVWRLEAEFAAEDARQMKAIVDLLPHLWT